MTMMAAALMVVMAMFDGCVVDGDGYDDSIATVVSVIVTSTIGVELIFQRHCRSR